MVSVIQEMFSSVLTLAGCHTIRLSHSDLIGFLHSCVNVMLPLY